MTLKPWTHNLRPQKFAYLFVAYGRAAFWFQLQLIHEIELNVSINVKARTKFRGTGDHFVMKTLKWSQRAEG